MRLADAHWPATGYETKPYNPWFWSYIESTSHHEYCLNFNFIALNQQLPAFCQVPETRIGGEWSA
ncbi:hypothetical protein GCM10027423_17110 [Spirosoma arcticum]